MSSAEAKERALLEQLGGCGSLIVAYSGGVDSTYLAYVAHKVLGERAIAVTAESPSLSRSHRAMAVQVADQLGFSHRFIATQEMDNPDYAKNAPDRCYVCKSELFDLLEGLRRELGFSAVAYGINVDDCGDFRPGHRAAEEHRVLSPLLDAGLSKNEIRELSSVAGLPTAALPSSACLASRIPYGTTVTPEKLEQVDRAEDALRELGYRQLRVRHHGDLARIELAPDEMPRALDPDQLRTMSEALHALGFKFVSLDLDGYRMGSLNELLEIEG